MRASKGGIDSCPLVLKKPRRERGLDEPRRPPHMNNGGRAVAEGRPAAAVFSGRGGAGSQMVLSAHSG
jgi:hypothetical protein